MGAFRKAADLVTSVASVLFVGAALVVGGGVVACALWGPAALQVMGGTAALGWKATVAAGHSLSGGFAAMGHNLSASAKYLCHSFG